MVFSHWLLLSMMFQGSFILCMHQYFIPFSGQVILCCLGIAHLFIHLPIDGHSGRFHLFAIMNDAAMNIWVQVLCGHLFSFLSNIYLGVKLRPYSFLFLLQRPAPCFMQCEASVDICQVSEKTLLHKTLKLKGPSRFHQSL